MPTDESDSIDQVVFTSSQQVSKKDRRLKRNLPERYHFILGRLRVERIVYEGYGISYLESSDPASIYVEPKSYPIPEKRPGRKGKKGKFFEIRAAVEGILVPSPVTGEELLGRTYFIAYGAPGDILEVRIQREKKNLAWGYVHRVIQPSNLRETPPCPVFGECGGCQMQHLSYETEIAVKEEFIRDFFSHLLRKQPKADAAKVFPVKASDSRFAYRNHIQIKTDRECRLGFFSRGNKRVVPLPEQGCLLLPQEMNSFLRGLSVEQLRPNDNFRVRQNSNNQVLAKRLNQEEAPTHIEDTVDGIRFRIKMDNFFQINRYQLSYWIELIVALADLQGSETVLDLYCGGGLITLPLAKRAQSAVGIEINPMSIRDARATAEENGIENVRFIAGDALEQAQLIGSADVIVVDPPRAGCDQALIDWLIATGRGKLGAKKLIYISCNPATFFRDADLLLSKGALLKELHPVDMFPMTYHVEIISLFHLSGSEE